MGAQHVHTIFPLLLRTTAASPYTSREIVLGSYENYLKLIVHVTAFVGAGQTLAHKLQVRDFFGNWVDVGGATTGAVVIAAAVDLQFDIGPDLTTLAMTSGAGSKSALVGTTCRFIATLGVGTSATFSTEVQTG